jgi:hypothetical protein
MPCASCLEPFAAFIEHLENCCSEESRALRLVPLLYSQSKVIWRLAVVKSEGI